MLPKPYRLKLRQKRDFFSHCHIVETPAFRWYIQEVKLGHTQFACLVGKVVSTKAVIRNRIKRQTQQEFSKIRPTLPKHLVVGVARKQALSAQQIYVSVSSYCNQVCAALPAI